MIRISQDYQKVLEKISSVELTSKESDRLKVITRDEKITKSLNVSFEDPFFRKVFVSSFEDPFFRPKFFDDPILAVDKLKDRDSVFFDPVIPGKDAPDDPRIR
ncbi:MAG: hypothetical protein MUQ27_01440 [Acidimicrobiia bacterium]|nr:hypothetical protein [Acidimicrobiia bacterium]